MSVLQDLLSYLIALIMSVALSHFGAAEDQGSDANSPTARKNQTAPASAPAQPASFAPSTPAPSGPSGDDK